MVVGTHGVNVIVLGDESSVTGATGNVFDGYVVRAKSGNRVGFILICFLTLRL